MHLVLEARVESQVDFRVDVELESEVVFGGDDDGVVGQLLDDELVAEVRTKDWVTQRQTVHRHREPRRSLLMHTMTTTMAAFILQIPDQITSDGCPSSSVYRVRQ